MIVERPCDMSRGKLLKIHVFDDGDVQVLVQDADYKTLLTVFREPFRGGGSSPKTHNALLNLARAMQEDEAERPARNLFGQTT
jgi:hypothetical protein